MSGQQEYNPIIADIVLRYLSVDDIVLVMRARDNVDASSVPKIEAFTLMLMGLKETCQIRLQLTDYTKT